MTATGLIGDGLDTPFLAVDVDALERNLTRMAGVAQTRGLALRPHAKTHKCPEIARRQVGHGAAGLTVATVGEAEIFAASGFADLFIAYPIWAAGARAARLRAVAEQVSLRVGVDSAEGPRRSSPEPWRARTCEAARRDRQRSPPERGTARPGR